MISLEPSQVNLKFSVLYQLNGQPGSFKHELEKLRFYPEIELIMLVLWQPVAPFGSSCVLNRMSCTSSFPLKTQNKKNRSVRAEEKPQEQWRHCCEPLAFANSSVVRTAHWNPLLLESCLSLAFPIMPDLKWFWKEAKCFCSALFMTEE